MATRGAILLVGASDELGASLAEALAKRGHEVTRVDEVGAVPTEANEGRTDVAIFDASVGVLELRAAIDLLRDQPNVEPVHLVVMDYGEMSHVAAIDARAEPIVKPFFVPEVVAHVSAIIERKHEGQDRGELRGELSQVALFDLLQVLSSNRRTGKLRIEGERMAGDLWLEEGRIVDAVQGYAVGEKAMYRLLSVDSGSFVFTPALVSAEARIDRGTDAIVMEAVRRIDETKKAMTDLPGERVRYRVVLPDIDLPPLAKALVAKLEAPSLLREVLDLSDAPDLEILEMLLVLLETGVVEVDEASMNARLASDASTETVLRSAILRLRRKGIEGPIRLGVLGRDRGALARFERALGLLPEFVPPVVAPASLGRGLLGELGRIRVGATELQLFALPVDAAHRALLVTLLRGSRVALLVGESTEDDQVDRLAKHLDLRLVRFDATSDHPGQAARALREALDA